MEENPTFTLLHFSTPQKIVDGNIMSWNILNVETDILFRHEFDCNLLIIFITRRGISSISHNNKKWNFEIKLSMHCSAQ